MKCDVRNWDEQVQAFDAAVANSPHKSCDVVIANAGIVGVDDVYQLDGKTRRPTQPCQDSEIVRAYSLKVCIESSY